ncbi:hypothetical protein MTR67_030325 [Solanum verrucosum]|uniref:Uncharacterized protein n=1 Tax=Solanum verrucosum TaxID=315347 RepID=A0AAF0U0N7_SOLVR|nr:hypothetical protein MTR67_030325 [Solanum verrucosum]
MLNFIAKATKKNNDSWSLMRILVKEEILEIIWGLSVVTNSSEEAITFNSNNEENLENKGKSIQATRRGVGKDGVLSSPNVVASKQDNSIAGNSNNEWTLVSHKKNGVSMSSNNQILYQNNCTEVELNRSNIVVECTQFDMLRDENVG